MVRGVFITATDTGVGKTIVSTALVRLLRARGIDACGFKPIETGCAAAEDGLLPEDGMKLWEASGRAFPLDLVSPVRFRLPLAPYAAAREEKRIMYLHAARAAFRELFARAAFVVAEGVGGLMAPIERDYYVLDMAREFSLPALVVASPFLGTINHTLLTVGKALDAGIEVKGVVLNHHRPPEFSPAELTNRSVLEELLPVPVLGVLPYIGQSGDEEFSHALEGVISCLLGL